MAPCTSACCPSAASPPAARQTGSTTGVGCCLPSSGGAAARRLARRAVFPSPCHNPPGVAFWHGVARCHMSCVWSMGLRPGQTSMGGQRGWTAAALAVLAVALAPRLPLVAAASKAPTLNEGDRLGARGSGRGTGIPMRCSVRPAGRSDAHRCGCRHAACRLHYAPAAPVDP